MSKKEIVRSVRFTPEEDRMAKDLMADLDCSLTCLLTKCMLLASGVFKNSSRDFIHRLQLSDFSRDDDG